MNKYLEKCARLLADVSKVSDMLHRSHAQEALQTFHKHSNYLLEVVGRRHPLKNNGLTHWSSYVDDMHKSLKGHGPLKTDMMALHNKYAMKAKASGVQFKPKASVDHFISQGHATPDSGEVNLLG